MPESETATTAAKKSATTDKDAKDTRASKAVATTEPATGPLVTDEGRTTIADTVVSKIAGIATREVNGVHDLGGAATRTVNSLRERIPGSSTNLTQGVNVEVGERQAAVDIGLVADYGVPLADLAADVRSNVIDSIERMTGLDVTEVNIVVHDVYLAGEETEDTEPRVE